MHIGHYFKYRNSWMGLAILWIVLFHLQYDFGGDSLRFLSYIKSIGYGGVNIFLFASGIGCFCSLEKNDNLMEFFKRLIKRIFPIYIVFIMCWILYKALLEQKNLIEAIGNIT